MYFCFPFRDFSRCSLYFCPQFKAVICEVSLLGAYSDILKAELLIGMPFNPFASSAQLHAYTITQKAILSTLHPSGFHQSRQE